MVRETSSTLINNIMLLWQTKLEKCINRFGTTENKVGSMNGQGWEDKPINELHYGVINLSL